MASAAQPPVAAREKLPAPEGWQKLGSGTPAGVRDKSHWLSGADNTFRWLEQAYAVRTSRMPYMGVDLSFDPVRSDPRFADLLLRMGLPTDFSYQSEFGRQQDLARKKESGQ